jgi:hypothetical protein
MLGSFGNEFRTVGVVKKTTAGVYIKGEWVPGDEAEESVEMITIPITPAQLKQLPEGAYQAGDMRFYHKGSAVYEPEDVFIVSNIKYQVRDITDRSFEGNFTIYLAKRIYENN